MPEECPTCLGSGDISCPECFSNGTIARPGGGSVDCPRCKGESRVYYPCPTCGGTMQIITAEEKLAERAKQTERARTIEFLKGFFKSGNWVHHSFHTNTLTAIVRDGYIQSRTQAIADGKWVPPLTEQKIEGLPAISFFFNRTLKESRYTRGVTLVFPVERILRPKNCIGGFADDGRINVDRYELDLLPASFLNGKQYEPLNGLDSAYRWVEPGLPKGMKPAVSAIPLAERLDYWKQEWEEIQNEFVKKASAFGSAKSEYNRLISESAEKTGIPRETVLEIIQTVAIQQTEMTTSRIRQDVEQKMHENIRSGKLPESMSHAEKEKWIEEKLAKQLELVSLAKKLPEDMSLKISPFNLSGLSERMWLEENTEFYKKPFGYWVSEKGMQLAGAGTIFKYLDEHPSVLEQMDFEQVKNHIIKLLNIVRQKRMQAARDILGSDECKAYIADSVAVVYLSLESSVEKTPTKEEVERIFHIWGKRPAHMIYCNDLKEFDDMMSAAGIKPSLEWDGALKIEGIFSGEKCVGYQAFNLPERTLVYEWRESAAERAAEVAAGQGSVAEAVAAAVQAMEAERAKETREVAEVVAAAERAMEAERAKEEREAAEVVAAAEKAMEEERRAEAERRKKLVKVA